MECVALITAWEFNLVHMSCRAGVDIEIPSGGACDADQPLLH